MSIDTVLGSMDSMVVLIVVPPRSSSSSAKIMGGNGGVLAGKTAQTAGRNGVAMSRTTTKQFQAHLASAVSPGDNMLDDILYKRSIP